MKISGNSPISSVSKSAPAGSRPDNGVGREKTQESDKTLKGHNVRSAIENATDVDKAEVERIRQAIADGSLAMDSQTLARAVLDLHTR